MNARLENQTIALAGVFQAVAQVEQLAKTGCSPSDPLLVSMTSLFNQSPTSVLDVYGNRLQNIKLGLDIMYELLTHKQSRSHPDSIRYVLGILHLQKKLQSRGDMLGVIGTRLQQAQHQVEHFGASHENVMSSVAAIYSDTISTFNFRIQVTGDFTYLQQTRVANQVRALLLAGIRSATLWRQMGGNRFQVIFRRRRLAQSARVLLKSIDSE